MFYWVAKIANFTRTNRDLAKPIPTILLLCQLKTNFIAKGQLLYMGCPLTRKRKQKKTPVLIFKSVRVRLRESVRLREYVNTKVDWGIKRGFEKASVSRAVCLRESVR